MRGEGEASGKERKGGGSTDLGLGGFGGGYNMNGDHPSFPDAHHPPWSKIESWGVSPSI